MTDQLTTVQQLAARIRRSERSIERAANRLGFAKVEAYGVPRWLFTAEQCDEIERNTHDGPGQPRKVRADA